MKAYRTLCIFLVLAVAGAVPVFAVQNDKAKGQQRKAEKDRQAEEARIRFRGMDRDGDGVITRAEWRGNDQSFRQHDTNHDGVLSGAEVRAIPSDIPWTDDDSQRRERLNTTFSRLDRDNDGRLGRNEWEGDTASFDRADVNNDRLVTRAEFLDTVRDRNAPPAPPIDDQARRRERLLARFGELDRDDNGRLRRNEWNADAASFDRADANRDGVISRAEFINAGVDQPAPSTGDNRRGTRSYQAGYDRGLVEGRQAGKEDRTINGGKWDLEGQRELEQADSGYDSRVGAREEYQAGYRAGFRLGYREGFGPR